MAKDSSIAVKPTQPIPKIEIVTPDNVPIPISNWGIVAAILIAAMPHLWQWVNGHQKARNSLTETLLQNLTDAHKQNAISNDAFRKMVADAAERPTELAESNALALRDLQGEVVDLRTQMQAMHRKIDNMASILTRLSQSK
jgi:hypothetical protein